MENINRILPQLFGIKRIYNTVLNSLDFMKIIFIKLNYESVIENSHFMCSYKYFYPKH